MNYLARALSIALLATSFTHAMDSSAEWLPIIKSHNPHPQYVNSYQDFQKEKLQWVARLPMYEYLASNQLQKCKLAALSSFSDQLTPELLADVKARLGASRNDRLPNGAKYILQFHLFVPGLEEYIFNIAPDAIFISGGRHFDSDSREFVQQNKLRIASNHFLNPEQFKGYLKQEGGTRGIYIGKIMEEALRKEVIGGAWKDNALDSEALILLHIARTLPNVLDRIVEDAKHRLTEKYSQQYTNYKPNIKGIHINRMVLGISSYYKPCHLCRNLIQGFQFRFREMVNNISKTKDTPFEIRDNFGSLSLVYGQVDSRNALNSEIEDKAPYLANSWPQIQLYYHQYAECEADRPKKAPPVAALASPALTSNEAFQPTPAAEKKDNPDSKKNNQWVQVSRNKRKNGK